MTLGILIAGLSQLSRVAISSYASKFKVNIVPYTNLLGQPFVAMVAQSPWMLEDLPPTPGSRQPPTRPGVTGFGGFQW